MTGTAASQPGASDRVLPLLRRDPPRLGDIALSGRLAVSDAGIVYAGVLGDQPVAVAMLTAGAETDGYARARFHDAVRDARLAAADITVVAGEDDPDIAPWVAVSAGSWDDAAKLAGALLAPVTLEHVGPTGDLRGPAFRPHWLSRGGVGPGRWRTWPLPWPTRLTASGRWTYAASFAVVLAIASVALFIAVKLFDGLPPAPVGPPFPPPSMPTPSIRPTPSPTPTSPSTQSPSTPGGPGTGADGSPRSPGGTGNTSIV